MYAYNYTMVIVAGTGSNNNKCIVNIRFPVKDEIGSLRRALCTLKVKFNALPVIIIM